MADLTQAFHNDNLYVGFLDRLTLGVQNLTGFSIALLPLLFVSNVTQRPGLPTSAHQGTLNSKAIVGIGVGVAAVYFLLLLTGIGFLLCWGSKHGISWKEVMRNIGPANPSLNALPIADPGRPWKFSFQELRAVTKNFSSDELLGMGEEFGSVYKGKLADMPLKWFRLKSSRMGESTSLLPKFVHHQPSPSPGTPSTCRDGAMTILTCSLCTKYMSNGSLNRILRRIKPRIENGKSCDQFVLLPWQILY